MYFCCCCVESLLPRPGVQLALLESGRAEELRVAGEPRMNRWWCLSLTEKWAEEAGEQTCPEGEAQLQQRGVGAGPGGDQ